MGHKLFWSLAAATDSLEYFRPIFWGTGVHKWKEKVCARGAQYTV